MFSKIFNITTKKYNNLYNRKIINIFGIKISYLKEKNGNQINKCKEKIPERLIYKFNCNMVNIVFSIISNADLNDLYCMRNNTVCYIFNKNVLKFGYNNFCDFILNSRYSLKTLLSFEKLDNNSNMYKEHISRAKNNEFLWKYMIRNTILHKFISFDEKNQIFINEKILFDEYYEDENNKSLLFRAKNSKRLFIQGTAVKNYLEDKPTDIKIQVIIKLIDYIFQTYGVGENMIDGSLYDCHLNNFIIDSKQNFHFIDDEYISPKPVSKEHVIQYILKYYNNNEVAREIYQHYGLKIKNKNPQTNSVSCTDELKKMKMEYFK